MYKKGATEMKNKTAREALKKQVGYPEELLSEMTDEQCQDELMEVPYNS